MSEFPQNRSSCFSEEEVAAAAAQRFCLGNEEAHGEEEMLVVVDVDGPRTDAHARSTIALLMCALFLFLSLSNVSNVYRTQVKKKSEEEEKKNSKIREEKKRKLLISIKQTTTSFARARADYQAFFFLR